MNTLKPKSFIDWEFAKNNSRYGELHINIKTGIYNEENIINYKKISFQCFFKEKDSKFIASLYQSNGINYKLYTLYNEICSLISSSEEECVIFLEKNILDKIEFEIKIINDLLQNTINDNLAFFENLKIKQG